MNGWKEEKGNTVTVYDRYHFAVPVRGIIRETNHNSFKVNFFTNNSGSTNVNKHDGKWFLKGQCKVDEKIAEDPLEPKKPSHEEIMTKWWRVDHGHSDISWVKPFTYIEGGIEAYGLLFRDEGEHFLCGHRTFKSKKWFIGRESADIPPETE